MENRTQTIEELNDILERNYDSVAGYEKAAENVKNSRLKNYLTREMIARKEFIKELAAEVLNLGGTPKSSGTIEGTFHRAWIDFKSAISFENDESVLEACITGEAFCLKEYSDLLEEKHLPESTRRLLSKQKEDINVSLRTLEIKEERIDE